jgi:hypothetical protein
MIKWHPTKSSIASTTNQGSILIWHFPNPERWGAFAGGFEEVDENVEYEEREDEFDIVSVFHYHIHLLELIFSSRKTNRCFYEEK